MKRTFLALNLLAGVCGMATAQAVPTANRRPTSELNIQGGAIFARAVTDNGIRYKPTSAGSVGVSYRFYITRWLGVEGDFD